jgi:hypothetical protein
LARARGDDRQRREPRHGLVQEGFRRLDGAWPARDQAFERWFDPSNFDEAGRQRISARETV